MMTYTLVSASPLSKAGKNADPCLCRPERRSPTCVSSPTDVARRGAVAGTPSHAGLVRPQVLASDLAKCTWQCPTG